MRLAVIYFLLLPAAPPPLTLNMDDVIVATFSPVGDVAVVEVTISTLLATEVTVELLDDSDAVIQSQTVRVVCTLWERGPYAPRARIWCVYLVNAWLVIHYVTVYVVLLSI